MECHHDDYDLVIHSTGEAKKMEDIDWDQMMEWMVAANVEKHGCIYENDDIIVEHQMLYMIQVIEKRLCRYIS